MKHLLITVLSSIFFLLGNILTPQLAFAVDVCTINSATLSPSGLQPTGFYDEDSRPSVTITINTSHCAGKKIIFSLVEEDPSGNNDVTNTLDFNNHEVFVPESEQVVVHAKAGEDECDYASSPQCHYFIEAGNEYDIVYSYSSLEKPNGDLFYKYDGVWHLDGWQYISDNGAAEPSGEPTNENEDDEQEDEEDIVQPTVSNSGTPSGDGSYELISDLPLVDEFGQELNTIEGEGSFGKLLNLLFTFAIGVAGVLAVVMIVYHAWEYLTTESVPTKTLLKDKLLKIVLGILLLFGSVIILRTINPDLLNLEPNIDNITNFGGMTSDPVSSTVASNDYTPPGDIICPKEGGTAKIPDIIASLNNNVTYRLGGKGQQPPYGAEGTKMCENNQLCKTSCPADTVCLDCSGFVDYVYKCAGIPSVGASTGEIFNNGTPTYGVKLVKSGTLTNTTVTVAGQNGDEVITLKVGDLLGWPTTYSPLKYGHVVMYIGNGKISESTSYPIGRNARKGLQPANSVMKYKNKIKYFVPVGN